MKKSAKVLLGTAGVFTGIGIAMNACVLTRLSKTISDKKCELEEKKNPTDPNSPVALLEAEGDAWLEKQDYDHIVIKNAKNKPIHAYVVKAKEPTDKWVICVHGYTSEPKRMGSYALHHHNRGYNILLPALRGHNVSEQHNITMGWLDRLDMLDWINYLIKTYGDISIVLHGVSMGAATVMMTTGEKLPENVKCCVADCGYSSVWDEFKNEMKQTYHTPPLPILIPSTVVSKVVNGYGFREASCVNQLKKSVTPTIFIHGEEDVFVPYRMMDLNYNAAACEKEKLSVPDAEHAEAHLVHPELYWSNTFRFIDKYVK
ncbi:MAG: alpha/beta hydrolase [Clostridia bacterium]|nr:alpha/beta hydrolase [Clostridia bacterium]